MTEALTSASRLGLLTPVGGGVPGGYEVALQMHLDDRVPVGLGHVDQYPVPQDAGVVDQDVKITEGLDGRIDQALATVPVGDVVGVGHRPSPGGDDLVDHLLGGRPVVAGAVDRTAEVVDHHLGPLGREEQGVLAPDTPTGSGDDGDTSVQCSHAASPGL